MNAKWTFRLFSKVESSVWIDANTVPALLRHVLDKRYGFDADNAFINDHERSRPLRANLSQLLARFSAGNIDALTLGSTYDGLPQFDFSFSRDPEAQSDVSLDFEVASECANPDEALLVIERAKLLFDDSRAQYGCGHLRDDLAQLMNVRKGDLLLLNSLASGAYWLTYYCDEYVDRLGGPARLRTAPVWRVDDCPRGMLLVSHPDPWLIDRSPKSDDIAKLQTYVQSLVPVKDRP